MRVRKQTRHRWTGVAAAAALGALSMALLVWLVVMPATGVQAATYTVNVTTDDADAAIDGVCATGGGDCTLRAAIQEANASAADDVIAIGVVGPIVLNAGLPLISDDDLIITGSGQQVSLTVAGVAFDIDADRVQISELLIDGEGVGSTGIQISGATDELTLDGVTVRGFTSWGFQSAGGAKRNNIINCTFISNGADGIDFNGGEENEVRNCQIINNGDNIGDNGLEVSDEDHFVIQGNTFSGNFDAQIFIGTMPAGQDMLITRNSITSSSDGIVIGAPVSATANIDIGLSEADRNVFRGAIAAPGEQHLKNRSPAHINAIYNDWDAYSPAAIEGVICHNGEAGCGAGVVDFDPFVDHPSPLETATPTGTLTGTPGTPAVTPTGTPAVTVTPTPGGIETVSLIAGCNPLAWTGANATPSATIVDAVAPPGILIALWKYDIGAGGVWRGYSPVAPEPEISDLRELNRLDVVFVCVISPGTINRPRI